MKPFSRLAIFATALSDVALVGAVLSGIGARSGWWHFRMGFKILEFAVLGALFAAFLHVIGLLRREKTWSVSIFGLLFSLGIAALPLYYKNQANRLPRIHDITTDPLNPPRYKAVLALRRPSDNSLDYDPSIAPLQKEAYPDIQPLVLPAGPGETFSKALDVVQKMGWQVAREDSAQGVIEAVDTTRWFGFKDDIMIRLTPLSASGPASPSTRIDVRSVSRVGKSDMGTNARRVRKLLEEIRKSA